jgi:hypothetical protein
MSQKFNIALALAAGLIGGVLSRNLSPPSVHAQAQNQAPSEIRAQSITLIDAQGRVAGIFTSREAAAFPNRFPRIVLLDRVGNVIWSATSETIRPLSEVVK